MDTINIPEKTLRKLLEINNKIEFLQATAQNIILTILEVNGAEGNYLFDGTKLVKKEE